MECECFTFLVVIFGVFWCCCLSTSLLSRPTSESKIPLLLLETESIRLLGIEIQHYSDLMVWFCALLPYSNRWFSSLLAASRPIQHIIKTMPMHHTSISYFILPVLQLQMRIIWIA